MKGRKKGQAFQLYIKRSENIGTRWNDLKGGLPFELSSQIHLQVDEGEEAKGWNGAEWRSTALQRRVTQRRSLLVVERGLWRYHGHYIERYIANLLPSSAVCFFSNRLRIAAENHSRSRREDLRMDEIESSMYLYNHGYDWRKRRSTARQIMLNPIAYCKYEFALE